jgi:hypothetical protein
MRGGEARQIRCMLEKISSTDLSPCVNLGSSTTEFRKLTNPEIDRQIIGPLEDRGVSVVHVDLKNGNGVNLVGDIFDVAIQGKLAAYETGLMLCCNMMEHIEQPTELAEAITRILPSGAYLLVSVPFSFPLHLDPIDTYFRPAPSQILEFFPGFDHVESTIVNDSTYLQDILSSKSPRNDWLKLLKKILTIPYPFFGPGVWKLRHHRLLWLFRRYKISCVLMRKK